MDKYRYRGTASPPSFSAKRLVHAPDPYASPGLILQWYLMASYLKELDLYLVPEWLYARWADALLARWDDFEHRHKCLLSPQELRRRQGTTNLYPGVVIHAAEELLRRCLVEVPTPG